MCDMRAAMLPSGALLRGPSAWACESALGPYLSQCTATSSLRRYRDHTRSGAQAPHDMRDMWAQRYAPICGVGKLESKYREAKGAGSDAV